ncbi:hypothetical protein SDC9_59560 [bioreactor metagenome]|uniref:Uncharacterized protein n=1 Tax=bioreactor metagenome TaxID=1076179 RepID=A0A644XAF1_9ZZZZ
MFLFISLYALHSVCINIAKTTLLTTNILYDIINIIKVKELTIANLHQISFLYNDKAWKYLLCKEMTAFTICSAPSGGKPLKRINYRESKT